MSYPKYMRTRDSGVGLGLEAPNIPISEEEKRKNSLNFLGLEYNNDALMPDELMYGKKKDNLGLEAPRVETEKTRYDQMVEKQIEEYRRKEAQRAPLPFSMNAMMKGANTQTQGRKNEMDIEADGGIQEREMDLEPAEIRRSNGSGNGNQLRNAQRNSSHNNYSNGKTTGNLENPFKVSTRESQENFDQGSMENESYRRMNNGKSYGELNGVSGGPMLNGGRGFGHNNQESGLKRKGMSRQEEEDPIYSGKMSEISQRPRKPKQIDPEHLKEQQEDLKRLQYMSKFQPNKGRKNNGRAGARNVLGRFPVANQSFPRMGQMQSSNGSLMGNSVPPSQKTGFGANGVTQSGGSLMPLTSLHGRINSEEKERHGSLTIPKKTRAIGNGQSMQKPISFHGVEEEIEELDDNEDKDFLEVPQTGFVPPNMKSQKTEYNGGGSKEGPSSFMKLNMKLSSSGIRPKNPNVVNDDEEANDEDADFHSPLMNLRRVMESRSKGAEATGGNRSSVEGLLGIYFEAAKQREERRSFYPESMISIEFLLIFLK